MLICKININMPPIRLDKLPIPPKYVRFPNGPAGAIARSVIKTGHIIIPAPRFGKGNDENVNILTNAAEAQITSDDLATSTNAISSFPQSEINNQEGTGTAVDWRARLRPKGGRNSSFWQESPEPSLLTPLQVTGGMIWQYTPKIFVSGNANYNTHDFFGSNYPYVTYKNSSALDNAVISSEFSANTIEEGKYMLGVLHFLRTATKSFYGDEAVLANDYGTPPPVMLFEYLGKHGFNKVPVVITNYGFNFDDNIDYVPIKTNIDGEETTFMPVYANISVTIQPAYTPHKLRKKFNLREFTTGKSYMDGFV